MYLRIFNINIIQVCAPTTDHDDDEAMKFRDDIGNVMQYAKSGEIITLVGGWNAKVVEQLVHPATGKFSLDNRNDGPQTLVDVRGHQN